MLDFYRTKPNPAMAGGILMRVEARGMTSWWKRELVLTGEGLEWDVWSCQQLVKMTLPFERIRAVEVLWGPYLDDVRVVCRNDTETMLVRSLDKLSAARVKALVERRLGALCAA